MYAEVVLELPIHKSFDYLIPAEIKDAIRPGMRVSVMFGPRRVSAYIIKIKEVSSYKNAKPILKLIDKTSLLSQSLVQLAEWIAAYYFTEIGNVFKTMLPSMVRATTAKKDHMKYVAAGKIKVDILKLEKKAPKQAEILKILYEQKIPIKLTELLNLSNTSASAVESLRKKELVEVTLQKVDRDPYKKEVFQSTFPLVLNEDQERAFEILSKMDKGTALLYGVTSSGKTEIYLQMIARKLEEGKGAIVIVPEISLTPQAVERFKSRFLNENVAVLHSKLSFGERYDQWQKIYEGKAKIVIGARSAIFAPVRNLGLIVVDEEHERTFKQEDDPRYHARDVAVKRGEVENALVILGSATPSMESYKLALDGVYKLIKLPKRIDDRPLAKVRIISLKDEIKKFHRFMTFSPLLLTKINERLQKRQQVILFLNRRGFSPFVICRHCGFVIRCHSCTTALTYHQLEDKLICHTCGYFQKPPNSCPECKNVQIRFGGIGTERVESQIAKFFPMARIRRMDTDVTVVKGAHKEILDKFKNREIDILVGTQMIAKGLDFPNVTLVGVISADVALHLPDFRAGENTFQLLTQVAGRAGRGEVAGEVIIQTMTPEHPAIMLASTQDYERFAESELAIRKELDYPPFEHFVNITFRSRNPNKSEFLARQYQKIFDSTDIKVYGPIPAPISFLRGYYRWQILLKSPSTENILPYLEKIEKHEGVFITVDIDPISML